MFTGLVVETGSVASVRAEAGGAEIEVVAGEAAAGARVGDSIAVSGVCLTVTSVAEARGAQAGTALGFHASGETLRATTLGALKPGALVNLEPSLRPSDRMGGHFVTGHVDAVGRIRSRTPEGRAALFEVEAPREVLRYLVDKGSVAVDGVSLTVVRVLGDSFTIVIIPHTADATTIGRMKPGDRVNLEADILGKYVYRFLNRREERGGAGGPGGGGLMDALERHGFTGGPATEQQ